MFTEKIFIDLFDNANNKICQLYDNYKTILGQACNVVIKTKRNGWQELSFEIPTLIFENGRFIKNFRIENLKNEYKIRTITDEIKNGSKYEVYNWYIINSISTYHNKKTTSINVSAGHVSKLLEKKNLGLEFSIDEGNNVGTAEELLTCILNGTDWKVGNVYDFKEKDGSTKYRTLNASEKTGAFKLISSMCDLFEAKPIYRCNSEFNDPSENYVDIIPMNPFSENLDGGLPDVSMADDVIEIHYSKNLKSISKSSSTDSLTTKLYAYGSYGTKTYGYCSIQEAEHYERWFCVDEDIIANKIYYFKADTIHGNETTYYFCPKSNVEKNHDFVLSYLDSASIMYLWNDTTSTAYRIYSYDEAKEKFGIEKISKAIELSKYELPTKTGYKKNWFDFIMDYNYYKENDLLSDDMIQKIAEFQRIGVKKYEEAQSKNYDASLEISDLSNIVGSIDYGKLNIAYLENDSGYLKIILNDDYLLYRSDYYEKTKDQFEIYGATEYDDNGDPIPGTFDRNPSIAYIINDNNLIKAYVRDVDDHKNPSYITLNIEYQNFSLEDNKFFIFYINNINGILGALDSTYEALEISCAQNTTIISEEHPLFFNDGVPKEENPNINAYEFCWCWDYKNKNLYYSSKHLEDTKWEKVYIAEQIDSEVSGDYGYKYIRRISKLYKKYNDQWIYIDPNSPTKQGEIERFNREISLFGTVYMYAVQRDRLFDGEHENNFYTVINDEGLEAGNYCIKSDYDMYYVFTTTKTYPKNTIINYKTGYDKLNNSWKGWITISQEGVVNENISAKSYYIDAVGYKNNYWIDEKDTPLIYLENEYYKGPNAIKNEQRNIWIATIPESSSLIPNRKYYIICGDNVVMFTATENFINNYILEIDENNMRISIKSDEQSGLIIESVEIQYILNKESEYLQKENINDVYPIGKIFLQYDTCYEELLPIEHIVDGKDIRHGIYRYIKDFSEKSDDAYLNKIKKAKEATEEITQLEYAMMNCLGSMHKEGFWQDNNYVDGDEKRLYEDAQENLDYISKPVDTYNIDFLDTREIKSIITSYNADDKIINENINSLYSPYQCISIMSAVHIVDEDININKWAFIDEISKCYDLPWKTKLTINTNLTTITQHSFTDFMTTIADVASSYKGKSTIYSNTPDSYYSRSVNLDANNIFGGKLNGAIIQENSIDGSSLMSASIVSDKILAGSITGDKIAAKSITGDKIAANSISADKIDVNDLSAKVINSDEMNSKLANINVANIKWNKSEFAASDFNVFKYASGGKLTVTDLIVEDANIANLSAGNINLVNTSGKLVQLYVNPETGLVETKDVTEIEGNNIKEDTIGVYNIKVDDVFEDEEVNLKIAENIAVDQLFARKATIDAITGDNSVTLFVDNAIKNPNPPSEISSNNINLSITDSSNCVLTNENKIVKLEVNAYCLGKNITQSFLEKEFPEGSDERCGFKWYIKNEDSSKDNWTITEFYNDEETISEKTINPSTGSGIVYAKYDNLLQSSYIHSGQKCNINIKIKPSYISEEIKTSNNYKLSFFTSKGQNKIAEITAQEIGDVSDQNKIIEIEKENIIISYKTGMTPDVDITNSQIWIVPELVNENSVQVGRIQFTINEFSLFNKEKEKEYYSKNIIYLRIKELKSFSWVYCEYLDSKKENNNILYALYRSEPINITDDTVVVERISKEAKIVINDEYIENSVKNSSYISSIKQEADKVEIAISSAETAGEKANIANAKAEEANVKAETAEEKANTANAKADFAESIASEAQANANAANIKADSANVKAETAEEKANTANIKAEDANAKAETAETKADSANTKATEANTKADLAEIKADAANTKADSAENIASEAYEEATSASTKAEEATTKAETAEEKANTANIKADSANTKAEEAGQEANAASLKADSAEAKAEEADEKASTAQETAEEAYEEAHNAYVNVENIKKVLTFDYNTGLTIKDITESTQETINEININEQTIKIGIDKNPSNGKKILRTIQNESSIRFICKYNDGTIKEYVPISIEEPSSTQSEYSEGRIVLRELSEDNSFNICTITNGEMYFGKEKENDVYKILSISTKDNLSEIRFTPISYSENNNSNLVITPSEMYFYNNNSEEENKIFRILIDENLEPKIEIGDKNKNYLDISSSSVDFINKNNSIFSIYQQDDEEKIRIGKINNGHVIIDDESISIFNINKSSSGQTISELNSKFLKNLIKLGNYKLENTEDAGLSFKCWNNEEASVNANVDSVLEYSYENLLLINGE